jgi:hypothetical protein
VSLRRTGPPKRKKPWRPKPSELKPTPLKRGESRLSSTTPIRKVSPRRAKENRVRRKNLIAEFGPNPECAIKWDAGCRGWAEHGHEILKRSRGGSITDVSNVVPACDYCNGQVEDFPDEAMKRGWAVHSWDRDRGAA